jgi:prepilin-type N-terminal cleavage/methylation domain-containing protein
MKNGFTLVELSIVLVIVGLLIGGILVAQSLISTSRIAAQVAQIQQFDAAVMNFKTRYNYLPGDAPGFGGDGNGVIASGFNGYSYYTTDFLGDIAGFWTQLFPDQFPTPFPYAIVYTSGPLKNSLNSKMGKPGSYFLASALSIDGVYADMTNPRNYYSIIDPSQLTTSSVWRLVGTTSTNSPVKPVDLLALDKKMDDGLPTSGGVMSGDINDVSIAGAVEAAHPLASCSAASYVLTDDYVCTPIVRIGAQAGNPQ